MIVDANILISAVLGSAIDLQRASDRGLDLIVPDAQLAEAKKVLSKRFAIDGSDGAQPTRAFERLCEAPLGLVA